MFILELFLEPLVEGIGRLLDAIIFAYPKSKLQEKITRQAKKHTISTKQLNKLANVRGSAIKKNDFNGFDFTDCSYLDLRRLWHNIKAEYGR